MAEWLCYLRIMFYIVLCTRGVPSRNTSQVMIAVCLCLSYCIGACTLEKQLIHKNVKKVAFA